MNIMYRKLAMLEKDIQKREEAVWIHGYSTKPVDTDLKNRVTWLLEQVKYL